MTPEHAAPLAEGLDEAVALLREWSKWAHEEAPTSQLDALDYIVDSDILTDKTDAFLARLSRPSDEEEGTARICKRFRHDEHCIDERHA